MNCTFCCRLAAVLLAAALLLPGCGDNGTNTGANGRSNGPAGGSGRIEPIAVDPASIKVLDWDGVQQLVAGHKGKVVVVYLWATFNAAAKEHFPHLVRLARKHPEQLQVISVDCDYSGAKQPDELRGPVAEFLGKQGAGFEHVISSVVNETLYFEVLELPSGIPAVYVYNRDGKLARQFNNDETADNQAEFSFRKDVIPFVEKLVKP